MRDGALIAGVNGAGVTVVDGGAIFCRRRRIAARSGENDDSQNRNETPRKTMRCFHGAMVSSMRGIVNGRVVMRACGWLDGQRSASRGVRRGAGRRAGGLCHFFFGFRFGVSAFGHDIEKQVLLLPIPRK